MIINPYLNFMGKSEEAFNFYKSILGGEFAGVYPFKDTPDGAKLPADEQDKLMHIALPIGKNMLMATDMLESMGHKLTFGNNMSLSLNVDSREDADRIFAALVEGGKVDMPMADQSWGDYFGALVDKYGVQWMVNYNPNVK